MKNYVQAGDTLTFTNGSGSDLVSGAGTLVGTAGLFGVCAGAIADTETGEVGIKGVFNLAKKSTDTPAQWAKAYWDNTNKEVTTTATANTLIGVFTAAYVSGDVLANVKLIPAIA